MTDEQYCEFCMELMPSITACPTCGMLCCDDCIAVKCAAATPTPAADLRGLAERDQPIAPAPPAGAVTDLRATLDAQLEIMGELFDTAVHPSVSMKRKTQAVDQFRIALRFVRMLAAER